MPAHRSARSGLNRGAAVDRPGCVAYCVDVPTNLHLDDALIDEAVRVGHHASKREAVDAALREYVAWRRRVEATEAFGSFVFDPEYDYKAARTKRTA